MFHSSLNLCTPAGESTDNDVSSTSVCIIGESNPSAATGAARNGVFNVGTPLKDDPHSFRQFDQKEQQPPSMDASCKNTNTNCRTTVTTDIIEMDENLEENSWINMLHVCDKKTYEDGAWVRANGNGSALHEKIEEIRNIQKMRKETKDKNRHRTCNLEKMKSASFFFILILIFIVLYIFTYFPCVCLIRD